MAREPFQYAVIRVVPRIEREEFVNVGVILFCRTRGYLAARIELDEGRLGALAPDAAGEELRDHLEAITRVAAGEANAGPIARLAAVRAVSLAGCAIEHGDPDLAGAQRLV